MLAKVIIVFLIINSMFFIKGMFNDAYASTETQREYFDLSGCRNEASLTFYIPKGSRIIEIEYCIYQVEDDTNLYIYCDGDYICKHRIIDGYHRTGSTSTDIITERDKVRITIESNIQSALRLYNDSYLTITYEEPEVDTKKPTIDIWGVRNGYTYTSPVRAYFSASDESGIRSESATLNGSYYSSGSFISTSGSKTLRVTATDIAGNIATETVWFTVDLNDDPELSLTTNNNKVFSQEAGYNQCIISGNCIDVDTGDNITIKYNIKSQSNNPLGNHNKQTVINYSSSGSNKSFHKTINIDNSFTEGNYKLEVWAEDNNGGKSTVSTRNFKVDKTAPSINISGVSEGNVYHNIAIPRFSANDENGILNIKTTLNGKSFKTNTSITTGGHKILVINATDNVGNTSQKTIKFYVNLKPKLNITKPTENEYFGKESGHNSIHIRGTVNDNDSGDEISVKYTLYDVKNHKNLKNHTNKEIFTVQSSNRKDKLFNHSITVDNTMPSGKYELRITAEDDKGGKGQSVVTINIDNTAPQVNAPKVKAKSDTEIEITPNASDTSGLHTTETYIYNRDNTDLTEYVSDTSYNDTGLTANTQYTYKYKARDILDNESGYSNGTSKYTLALNPTSVAVTAKTSNSITFEVTNAEQGNIPQTRLEVKEKGAGVNGKASAVSEWSTETTRELNGLLENTEYEVWVQTRNGDNISNAKYCAVDSIRTNIAPSLSIKSVDNQTYSEIDGYNKISITGNFRDADAGDKLSLWLEIANIDIPLDTDSTFINTDANQDNPFDIELYFLNSTYYEGVNTTGFSPTNNGSISIGEQNSDYKIFKEDEPKSNQSFKVFIKNAAEGTSPTHILKAFGKDDKGGVANKVAVFTDDDASFIIDKTAPIFTNITSTIEDGVYTEKQQIQIKAALSENALVNTTDGKPCLTLNSGGTADYTGEDGENTSLTFTYIVGANENSDDLSVTGINLKGSLVTDKYGNPIDTVWANLLPKENTNLNDNSEIVIDTSPAVIESVTSSKADGAYKEGEKIQISVKFSEAVNSIGTPTLALNSGGTANYSSGSGTNTLILNYIVGSEDNNDDLNYAATDSLVLGEGITIKDIAGNNANIALPDLDDPNSLGKLKDIIIDNSAPFINSIDYNVETKKVTFDLIDTGAKLKELKYVFSDSEALETDFDTDYTNAGFERKTIDLTSDGTNAVKETIANDKDRRYIHFKIKDKLNNEVTSIKGLNQPPSLLVSTIENTVNLDYNGEFTINGTVTDIDKDVVTVTAKIGEIIKTTDINTATDDKWSLTWTGNELIKGLFEGISISAKDNKGGCDNKVWNGKVAINPFVKLNGDSVIQIQRESTFSDSGATSNYSVKVSSSVDTSRLGTYTITYTATNPVDITASATRKVIVVKNLIDRIEDKIKDIDDELDNLKNTREINLPTDITDLNQSIDELEKMIDLLPNGTEKDYYLKELSRIKKERDKLKEKVDNKAYFEEKIDKIHIDFETEPAVLVLPDITKGEYKVKVIDLEDNTTLIDTTSKGGNIEIPDAKMGHIYRTIVKIYYNSVLYSSIIFDTTCPDTIAPEITGIYKLDGEVYILGKDNYKLAEKPYGFKFNKDSYIEKELSRTDGKLIPMQAIGRMYLNADDTTYYKENHLAVNAPNTFVVALKDYFSNVTTMEITISDKDEIIYGHVPYDIRKIIKGTKKHKDRDDDVVITDSDITDELKEDIIETIKDTKVKSEDTELNSGEGKLTISISDKISDKYRNKDYKYRLDVIRKDDMKLVYTKILDKAENVEIPKLQDSTTYIVRISILKNNKELAFKEIEKTTKDRTAPIIQSIVVRNNTINVVAKDNVKLHAKAYKFEVVGKTSIAMKDKFTIDESLLVASTDNLLDIRLLTSIKWAEGNWMKDNSKKVEEGTKLIVTVRDAEGNWVQSQEVVADKNGIVQETVNTDDPLDIQKGSTIDINDILDKLIDKFDKNVNKDDIKAKVVQGDAVIKDGKLDILGNGKVVIAFTDPATNKTIQYIIYVADDNDSFRRRIIVEKGSQANLELAFKDTLIDAFGSNKNITFETIDQNITIKEYVLKAIKNGIGRIIASNENKNVKLYVVVADSISKVRSNIEKIYDNVAYTILKNKEVNIKNYLELEGENVDSNYLIVETNSDNIEFINDFTFKGTKEGIASITVIDLAQEKVRNFSFKIVDIKPSNEKVKDIQNHWAEQTIESSVSKGIINGYEDNTFRPNETVSTKEFLVMLNKVKLLTNKEDKKLSTVKLNKSDWSYYEVANATMGILENKLDFLNDNEWDEPLTREKAVYLINLILDIEQYEKGDQNIFSDLNSCEYQESIKAVRSILEGYKDGTFKGKNTITRAEALTLINRILQECTK